MNSSGNLSLGFTAGSTYNGTTSILNGTIVYLGNNALSDGTAVVINGGSLNIGNRTDTVGSVTLANGSIVGTTGILTVNSTNGGSYNMRNGTVSAILAGTAGLTKTTTGTVTLTGANTYSGATVIDDGKLEANTANSLGTNASITVNGGSLLVGADGAINTKNLTLASSATGNGTVASVIFSGSYNGTAGSLTLNQDSIIDLGEGSVIIRFSNLIWNANTTLSIYNWTGTTLWGGGNGDNPDQFYINNPLTSSELSRISFYSGIDNSSFVGTAYQLSGGSFSNEVIPVPEAETCFTALLLILGCVFWILRSCRTGENFNIWEHRVEKRENPATAVLFMGIGNRGGPFPVQLAARTDHPCSSLPHL
jgi:autotransporter-associated beta strand protein